MQKLRYQIHDKEIGHLRSFATKIIAEKYLTCDNYLIIIPKIKKPKIDFSKFEDALF